MKNATEEMRPIDPDEFDIDSEICPTHFIEMLVRYYDKFLKADDELYQLFN